MSSSYFITSTRLNSAVQCSDSLEQGNKKRFHFLNHIFNKFVSISTLLNICLCVCVCVWMSVHVICGVCVRACSGHAPPQQAWLPRRRWNVGVWSTWSHPEGWVDSGGFHPVAGTWCNRATIQCNVETSYLPVKLLANTCQVKFWQKLKRLASVWAPGFHHSGQPEG